MTPSRWVQVSLVLVAGCRCPAAPTTTPTLEPVRVERALAFPETFVGFSNRRALSLTNPGRSVRAVRLSTLQPFSTIAEVSLPGGESNDVEVVFAPLEPGEVSGVLELVDDEAQQTTSVQLTGRALAVPECGAPEPCHVRRFEVSEARCVDELVMDGASCSPALACFASATCVGGACLGAAVTCDDGKRCTLDVCSTSGCGQVDGTPFCPGTPDPCLVPSCAEASGCGLSAVPDGTACGRRTCTTALVCINGACVTRTPPMNQACADVLVGVAAGTGWSDGRGAEARFERPFAITAVGDVAYVSEKDVIRRVTLDGDVSTVAGRRLGTQGFAVADGVGSLARIGRAPGVAPAGAPGQVLFTDEGALRLLTHGALVTTLVPWRAGASGIEDGLGSAASLIARRLVPTPRGVGFATVFSSCLVAGCVGFDGGLLLSREATVRGEVSTRGRRRVETLPGFTAVGLDFLDAWIPTADAMCVSAIYDPSGTLQWRLRQLPDGGLGDDGTSCSLREFPSAPERFRVDRTSISGVDARGDVWFLGRGRSVDGPLSSAAIAQVWDADRDADGGLWFLDGDLVRRLKGGVVTTIAGPLPDRRLVDGPADAGRLRSVLGLVLTPDAVFFADPLEHVVRRASLLDFSLQSTGVRPAPFVPRDGPMGIASFQSHQTSGFHEGLVLVEDQSASVGIRTVRTLDPTTFEVRTRMALPVTVWAPFRSSGGELWAMARPGLRKFRLDGGVDPPIVPQLAVTDFDVAGLGTFVAAAEDSSGLATFATQLVRVDAAGQSTLLAGRPETEGRDFLAGPALTARLGSIKHVRVAPDGTVYWSQWDENAINALSTSGQVRRVIVLADQPLDFVVLPSGVLVVAVDAALLRVVP